MGKRAASEESLLLRPPLLLLLLLQETELSVCMATRTAATVNRPWYRAILNNTNSRLSYEYQKCSLKTLADRHMLTSRQTPDLTFFSPFSKSVQ